MKLKLKNYKSNKLKIYLKTTRLFFIFHGVNLTINYWTTIKQTLKKLNLTHYRLTNNLLKILLAKSIFKNLKLVLKGPCFFIKLLLYDYKTLLSIQPLLDSTHLLTFFCVMINNKVYNVKQIQNLKTLNHLTCIKTFHYFLQKYLYNTLKNF
uniref:hypothetical protein n=1 Tax=Odontella aurita TaxID=265563 RepID=UPI0020285DFF|nr:hypothetical protein NDF22_mgp15 [Odontella aurita]QYB22954.1 hypothetical protein [Odontella aurita]